MIDKKNNLSSDKYENAFYDSFLEETNSAAYSDDNYNQIYNKQNNDNSKSNNTHIHNQHNNKSKKPSILNFSNNINRYKSHNSAKLQESPKQQKKTIIIDLIILAIVILIIIISKYINHNQNTESTILSFIYPIKIFFT